MAYLRSCYYSSMRPFRDRPDVLIKGSWRWCPDGAKVLPFRHLFGPFTMDPSTMVVDPPVGEVPLYGGKSRGKSSTRYIGQNWCGSIDVWQNGALYSALGTPAVDNEGIPLCCLSAPPTPGGACANGEALWEFIGGGGVASGDIGQVDAIGGGGLGSGQVLSVDAIGGGGLGSGGLVVATDAIGGGGVASGSDGTGCVGFLGDPPEGAVSSVVVATVVDIAGVSGLAGVYLLSKEEPPSPEWNYLADVPLLGTEIFLEEPSIGFPSWAVGARWGDVVSFAGDVLLCGDEPGCFSQMVAGWDDGVGGVGIIGITVCLNKTSVGGGVSGGGLTEVSTIGGGGVAGGGLVEIAEIGGGGVAGGGLVEIAEIGGGGVAGGGLVEIDEIGGGGVASAEVAPMAVNLRSLRFDGASVYVSVPSAAILHPTTSLTLACWIKTTQSTLGRVIAQPKDPGGAQLTSYSLLIGYPTAGHCTLYGDAGLAVTLTSPGTINDGAWHHLAATWDGTTARLYVDGSEVSNTAVSGPPTYDSSALVFGRYSAAGQYFAGLMDEVALWVTALSAGDIAGLAAGSVSVASLSPDGYWPFEEGGDSTLHDRSGQGDNGTASVVSLWSLDHPPI
jgi:hypothetical protein